MREPHAPLFKRRRNEGPPSRCVGGQEDIYHSHMPPRNRLDAGPGRTRVNTNPVTEPGPSIFSRLRGHSDHNKQRTPRAGI